MLLATRHKRTRSAITPVKQAGTRFTYPGRMEGWVIAARPGIEPTTAWAQVRRPNRYTTESPYTSIIYTSLVANFVRCMPAKNCENWLTVDKVIAIIKRLSFLLDHGVVYNVKRYRWEINRPTYCFFNDDNLTDHLMRDAPGSKYWNVIFTTLYFYVSIGGYKPTLGYICGGSFTTP